MRREIVQTLRGFGWRQWLVVATFALVLGVTGWHVARTVRGAIYWRHHQEEPIRGWMTVGYVAHSYHVPPHVLYEALNLPREPRERRRPLREIAKSQGRTMDEIRAVLQDAITRARESSPPPPPPPAARDDGGKR
ncbi:MAG: hypothetical protein QOF61_3427 [Acidobacteriota bacterium]|nr:hypothetical protein [Acidobacteriota bacterium]